MTVSSVTVSGTLKLPSGLPAANAAIRFTLVRVGVQGGSVTITNSVKATANSNGEFSVSIAPSIRGTNYKVTVTKESGFRLLELVVVVPSTDCNLSQIIQPSNVASIGAAESALISLQATIAAQAAITTVAQSVTFCDFGDAPIYVNPGEFIQLCTRHVGTAATSGTIAHRVTYVYGWE